jgi:hypothetical protein
MKKVIFSLLAVTLFVSGCTGIAAKQEAMNEPMRKQIMEKDGNFYLWQNDGRHYVIGSQEMNEKFKKNGHIPYAKTVLGAGPNGETVVYEINKKDTAYVERLMKTYEETPFEIAKKGDISVYKKDGRIYVLGTDATRDKFIKNGHIPYAKTVLGAGPNGETIIYEIDKDNPELTEKLMKMPF